MNWSSSSLQESKCTEKAVELDLFNTPHPVHPNPNTIDKSNEEGSSQELFHDLQVDNPLQYSENLNFTA